MKILLTGASGSLGKNLEIEFARRNLFCVPVSSQRHGDPKYTKCDLSDLEQIKDLKFLIESENITCLVNNAALYSDDNISDIEVDHIVGILSVNLLAPIILSKYLYDFLSKTNRPGKIININSIAGKAPNFKESVYSASKHGLAGFGASLSINQKLSGIEVVDFFIGGMQSNITKKRPNFSTLMDPQKVASFIADIIELNTGFSPSSIDLRNNCRV